MSHERPSSEAIQDVLRWLLSRESSAYKRKGSCKKTVELERQHTNTAPGEQPERHRSTCQNG